MNQEQDKEKLTGRARSLANLCPPWKKGECGNKSGRPHNRVRSMLRECIGKKKEQLTEELNHDEVNTIESIILSVGMEELTTIAKSNAMPVYMKTLALAALHDMKNGKTKTMDLLRDRQFGAVKKEVDVTTNGGSLGAPTAMTPEEAKKVLKKIEEEY